MADFDPDAFLATKPKPKGFDPDSFLKSAPDELATAIADPTGGAEQRKREEEVIGVRNQVRKEESDFVKANAEEGIPMVTRKELPAMKRARLSAEPDPKVQAKMLTEQGMPARVSKDGRNVIVRQKGDDGKDEDILLHPFGGVTLGTIAGEAAPLAKMGANIGAAVLSGGTASIPILAARLGLGAAAIEGASTGGSRVLAGQEIGDTASRAVKEGTINAALPLAIGGGAAALKAGRNALAANPSKLAQDVAGASERTGVPVFPSQTADSKVLARGEEFAGLSKLKKKQQGAMGAAFDRELGPLGEAGVLSESEIAKKVQPIFQTEAEAAERGARISMTDAERAAQSELTKQLDAGLVPAGSSNTAVGQHTRKKFEDFVKSVEAKAAEDYPKFHAQAVAEGIELDKGPISNLVAKIEKEDPHGVADFLAPSVRQVKTVERKLNQPLAEAEPSGILGPTGKPVMTEEVPAPPLTFDEAIRQRAIVRQKLNAPDDPLGDVVKSYYKQLDRAYTEAIDDGLARGSEELRTLYETARSGYRKGAELLDKGVVTRLFREPGEAGRVADENVVKQLFTGEGKLEALRDMKQILGEKSADYKLLIRQGIQNMIDAAEQKGRDGLIDINAFLTKFNNLSKEMRGEMFGPLEPGIKAAADSMAIAQKGAKQVASIPADELADALLASPPKVRSMIERAVARQKAYEADYTNSVMQRLAGGKLGIKDLGNLDHFVSNFVPVASAADMRQILTKIDAASPGAANEIRARVLSNIRRDVSATKEVGTKTTGETFDLDADKIRRYTHGDDPAKYRVILGDKVMRFLDDMATIAESNAERIARGAENAITPRIFGKNALSGAAGLVRGVIGATVDLASVLPRAITGNAERFAPVREFLTTGNLPSFGKAASGLRAVPAVVRGASTVADDTRNERSGTPKYTSSEAKNAPPGIFLGTNGKLYEKLPNGKIEPR